MKKLFSVLSIALLFLVMGNQAFSVPVDVTPFNPIGGYPSLGAAFTAISTTNTHGLTPTITFTTTGLEVASTLTGSAFFNSVTITSSLLGCVITCASANPVITFNNVDNSTIDGNLGGGTLTFNLTLTTSGLIGGVNLSNGSSGNVIRDLAVTTTSLNGRLINFAQSNVNGAGNNNNTVENCDLTGGSRSLQSFGTALASGIGSRNLNSRFINNRCTNAATLPIFLGSEVEGATCDNNTIDYTGIIPHAALVNWRGILCQSLGTVNIRKNIIKNFKSAFATSTAIGIISIPATSTNPLPPANVINFINNCVTLTDINITGAAFVYGIAPLSNATTVAYTSNVFNNTCRIGGTSAGVAAYTVGIAIDVQVVGSVINSSNNICSNERTGGDAGTFHIGYDLTSFPFAGVTLNSDYNLGTSDDLAFGWDAGYNGFVYKGGFLSVYKDSTCAAGVEQHTSNDNVTFTGINSCVLAAGTVGGNLCGSPKATVTDDIFNTPRAPLYPYKGAYEGPAFKILTVTACLEGKVNSGEIQVFLETGATCTAVAQGFAFLDVNTNLAKICFGDAVSNGTPYQLHVYSINHIQTFSAVNTTFIAGAAAYNFTTQGAFGGNLSTGGCFFGGDVNKDSTIDVSDIISIANDASNFVGGCRLSTDINSDEFVDVSDLTITYNNSQNFVGIVSPCPEPNSLIEPAFQNQVIRNTEKIERRILTKEALNF